MIAGPKSIQRATEGIPQFMDSKTFAAMRYNPQWLIENILVKGQPAVIGGPKKSLKTSLAMDLAISIGTGTPFLGKFPVPRPRRVAFMSGESGEATIQETAERICRAKGVAFDSKCRVIWTFKLPRFQDENYRSQFTAALQERKVALVVIDPLYLCLFDGAQGLSASSLYDVGPLLLCGARACLDAGATPVFIHHARKTWSRQAMARTKFLDLDDLMFSGIGEFVRQWLLLNRERPYRSGTGEHELLMTVGGSAGHSGCWRLHVREGAVKEDFRGRRWQVEVKDSDGRFEAAATKGMPPYMMVDP